MKTLLVFALVAAVAYGQEEEMKVEAKALPLTYAGVAPAFPYAYSAFPYAAAAVIPSGLPAVTLKAAEVKELKPLEFKPVEIEPLTYTYQPVETKFVRKEIEIPVKHYEFEPVETSCRNSFGMAVPCNKAKRSADDEEIVEIKPEEAEEAPKAALPILGYSGFGVPAFGYSGLGLPLAAHPYALARPVEFKALEPKVHEIEVHTPVFKKVVEKIPVGPACQNHLGFAVPCKI